MTRITQLSSLPTTTQTLEEAPDYLSRLAPELLAKIISYLPQTAQQQLALTCRSFYPLVRATSVASFNRFLKKNLNTLPTFANITHLHLPEDKPIAVPTWKLLKNKFPNIRALRCVPPTPGTLATTFPALTHLSTPSLASLPPSLDHLHLEDPTNFTASNPDLFKNTSTLRSFSLKISQLSSLAFLASLENVTSLSLEVTNSAQTPLITAPLNGLKKLTTLKVTGNLKEVIAHLQYMPQLETLVLEHPSAGTDFTPLLSLKNLKRLAILISPDLQDLAFIKEMPELKYLKISHCPQLKNVQALVCLDKIIYLDLSHNFELSDILALATLTQLRSLNLEWCSSLEDISPLQSLTELTELKLNHNSKIKNITPLNPLSKLQKLELDQVNGATNIDLKHWPLLAHLNLAHCMMNYRSLTLSNLNQLTYLRELSLTGRRNLDLSGLLLLKNLSFIDLSDTGFSDADLAILPSTISSLHLEECSKVTHVANWPSKFPLLNEVNLQGCHIQDFRPLKNLPHLERLMLGSGGKFGGKKKDAEEQLASHPSIQVVYGNIVERTRQEEEKYKALKAAAYQTVDKQLQSLWH